MADGPLLGAHLELDVTGVAAGGSCVARDPGTGRVVFVRHALPGERVRAVVTEDRGGSFCRADAVEILRAAPERVDPPCPLAGPGRCGGCDWQHTDGATQRELKAAVVRDQFTRIGGVDLGERFTGVEELPWGLLGWRTRSTYAVGADGRAGLRRHASHEVEPVERCLLGGPGVGDSPVLAWQWPGLTGVEVVRGDDGSLTTLAHRAGPRRGRGRPADLVEVVAGPEAVRRHAGEHAFQVAAAGFWQVHPGALDALTAALLAATTPAPGERVLELFAGAGALTVSLAGAVGPRGAVLGIDGDKRAVEDARRNLAPWPTARVERARVDARAVTSAGSDLDPDVVVLDPPRAGVGRDVVAAIMGLEPRVIGYVSCDTATLARDVAAARDLDWELTALRAFDAFPMTHHVECVATLRPRMR